MCAITHEKACQKVEERRGRGRGARETLPTECERQGNKNVEDCLVGHTG
jgi:hypothetical protein